MHYIVSSYVNNKLYKVTSGGSVSTFASLSAKSGPHGIARHPDGYFLVTLLNTGKLAKVTDSGDVSVVASLPAGPAGVAVGASGIVYVACIGGDDNTGFGDFGTGSIVRIDPETGWSYETIASKLTGCAGVAVNDSGVLFSTNYIGGTSVGLYRIVDGVAETFATQVQTGSLPYGVVVDGADVITIARQGGRVSRFDPQGDVAFTPNNRLLHGAMGIAKEAEGTFVVANEPAGTLIRIVNGILFTLARVSKPLGVVVVP